MDTLLPSIICGLLTISLGYIITFWFRAIFAINKLTKFDIENPQSQQGKVENPRLWEISTLKSIIMSNDPMMAFIFIFTTPNWVKENPEARHYHKEFRKFTLFWNIGVLLWFLVFFILTTSK
jgi:predicted small integral membrane protein